MYLQNIPHIKFLTAIARKQYHILNMNLQNMQYTTYVHDENIVSTTCMYNS